VYLKDALSVSLSGNKISGRLIQHLCGKEKWEEILNIAKQETFLAGRVALHQQGDHPAHILNDQVDSLTCLATIAEGAEVEKWDHLLEWLHVKHSYSGFKDLFKWLGAGSC